MTLPEDTILENRYRIDRLLAQGGMGAIYRGFDTNLDIGVAIKENFFMTPQSIQQFQLEARILARLHHPNLPRVIDHFSFDGQQYLVMDYVEGTDLWEMIKNQKQPLDEATALNYIIQICDAVSYLHQYDPPIIHRDIKPQNIKVTPKGRAMLVDFGIAKMSSEENRTLTGAMGVTPGFSPPEQYSGAGTSPASDVYALGATLYAILTGEKPPDSISLLVNQAKFIPPNEVNTQLADAVSHLVIWAMKPQPEDRPQTVAKWQSSLKAVAQGSLLPPPPPKIDETENRTVMVTPQEFSTQIVAPPKEKAKVGGSDIFKKKSFWWGIGIGVFFLVFGIASTMFFSGGGEDDVDYDATITVSIGLTQEAKVAAAPPTDTPLPPTATPLPPTNTPLPPVDVTPLPPVDTPEPYTPTPEEPQALINPDSFAFPSDIDAVTTAFDDVVFFQTDQFLLYNMSRDKTLLGYPLPIDNDDDWLGVWPDGNIDSAINWENGKLYMFRGREYIRFDIDEGIVDEGYPRGLNVSPDGNWPGLWPTGNIDAAVKWGSQVAFFFQNDEYIRYNIPEDRADDGYPRLISGDWHGLWPRDIDAAVNYGNGGIYFFKGEEYIGYDYDTGDIFEGFPRLIADDWFPP